MREVRLGYAKLWRRCLSLLVSCRRGSWEAHSVRREAWRQSTMGHSVSSAVGGNGCSGVTRNGSSPTMGRAGMAIAAGGWARRPSAKTVNSTLSSTSMIRLSPVSAQISAPGIVRSVSSASTTRAEDQTFQEKKTKDYLEPSAPKDDEISAPESIIQNEQTANFCVKPAEFAGQSACRTQTEYRSNDTDRECHIMRVESDKSIPVAAASLLAPRNANKVQINSVHYLKMVHEFHNVGHH